MKKVSDYEVCDIGIEHSQYFQGFGTSFTNFDYAFYGVGETAREALDDCLEMIASSGDDIDIEDLEKRILAEFPGFLDEKENEKHSVTEYLRRENPDEWFDEEGEFMGEECELYYHVGIRYNLAAPLGWDSIETSVDNNGS